MSDTTLMRAFKIAQQFGLSADEAFKIARIVAQADHDSRHPESYLGSDDPDYAAAQDKWYAESRKLSDAIYDGEV